LWTHQNIHNSLVSTALFILRHASVAQVVHVEACRCGAGVYKEPSCMWKAEELDHAVTLMGYGTSEQGEDYWLIK